MKITLEKIRSLLRDTFGTESFIASFITRVEEDTHCPTASITAEGHLRYNPGFVDAYIQSREDLFCLVVHELMHPMFGHFVYEQGKFEDIATDMTINAVISLFYAGPSNHGSLFRKYYDDSGISGLLRPESRMCSSRYDKLYDRIYCSKYECKPSKLSTLEVIHALKVLTPVEEAKAVLLLGSHAPAKNDASMSQEMLAGIAGDLQRMARRPCGRCAGYGEALFDMLVEALKSQQGFKRALLERYLTKRKLDRFRVTKRDSGIRISPVPLQPSKRDCVMLAAGLPVLQYHNRQYTAKHEERGLAVYLDVSGSVNEHLPEIIGLLQRLKENLKTVYLFSTVVREIQFDSLLKGRVVTTYGTSFNCVAEHIVENELDLAVIVTDGFSILSEDCEEALRRLGCETLTVLFGDAPRGESWAKFGAVVKLADAVA